MEFSIFCWEIDSDFFFGTITRDITPRKRAAEEVRQARDYIENIFRASPDAIFVTDAEGYIVGANESVHDVYGYRPDELIETSVALSNNVAGLVRGMLETREDGKSFIITEDKKFIYKVSEDIKDLKKYICQLCLTIMEKLHAANPPISAAKACSF